MSAARSPSIRVLSRAIGRPLLFVVVLGLAWSLSTWVLPAPMPNAPQTSERVLQPESGPDAARVRVLLAEHRCWSGSAPEGAVAGAVVLTEQVHGTHGTGWATSFTRDRRTVGWAIDQAVFGKPHGLVVHGFCS